MAAIEEVDPTALGALELALAAPPTPAGGDFVVVASAGPPPAFALLVTSQVVLAAGELRVALRAESSAARGAGDSLSLLVADGERVLRASVAPLRARPCGETVVLEGPVVGLRSSLERPWRPRFAFTAEPGAAGADAHLRYWREMKDWLSEGAGGPAPQPPSRG